MNELLSLLTTIALFLLIVLVYRLIRKKSLSGWQWLYPCSLFLGYALTYVIYDQDNYWGIMKNILLYAFVISMISVNIKAIRHGAKSRMEHGKRFLSDVKTTYNDAKADLALRKAKKKNKNKADGKQETVQVGDDENGDT
jgi:hypothetical protein